jgi:hypothetical protein
MQADGATGAMPLALLHITNTARKPVAQIIEAKIPGWSHPLKQTEIVGPQETRLVRIQPALLAEAYRNEEIRGEQLDVSVTGMDGSTLFAESRPILIHGGSDLLWGHKFKNAQVAARWVTPHDPAVLDLVASARRFVHRGRMAGYGSAGADPQVVEGHVREQAEAVFRAMKVSGISYVNSLFVMGEFLEQAQRVRLPRETLALKTANCMDVSVAFASAMENLGLQPLLVIVPGHACVGVRLGRDSAQVLYLDLTVLPGGRFQTAASRARGWMAKTPPERVLVVDVVAARSLGLYPLVAAGGGVFRPPAVPGKSRRRELVRPGRDGDGAARVGRAEERQRPGGRRSPLEEQHAPQRTADAEDPVTGKPLSRISASIFASRPRKAR